MTVSGIAICASCVRLGFDDLGLSPSCAAFPDGIPDEIWAGGFDHRKPHEGDGGIRFELARGKTERLRVYEQSIRSTER